MRNLFWWILGGGTAALVLAARGQAQAQERIGSLNVEIELKPGTSPLVMYELLKAILSVRAVACPTFPDVRSVVEGPLGTAKGVMATYQAVWTHDVFGKIKEDVRVCLLNYLKGMNANVVNVSAERVS